MRELYLLDDESTETFLVLRDDEGVRYQLARTELGAAPAEPEPEPAAPEPSAPLALRPKEIQSRIRAGASQAELAEEMGVPESRIEPWAHPVILERYQIAEAAKQSHPLREDGPAKLTLFEVLATAFAARGSSLTAAQWDATRDPGDDWVVRVSWKAGLSENEAVWAFKRSMGSGATTEPRNSVAADLTDPDFAQPARPLPAPEPPADAEEVVEGDFLRHPNEEDRPQQRRRKAVTPHWEDVLLGVRTTPKRPKK